MLVRDLIKQLQERDPNEVVLVRGHANGMFGECLEVKGGYTKQTQGFTCVTSKSDWKEK